MTVAGGCILQTMQTRKEDRVEAVSMWDSREKYDAYLAFREESGELSEFAEKYYTADPQWKYMTVLMDFNK